MIRIPETATAARLLRSAARLEVRPVDVVLASTRLYSSLPLVGKHLEPFAGLTAMALWGGHYAPATIRAAVSRRIGVSADVPGGSRRSPGPATRRVAATRPASWAGAGAAVRSGRRVGSGHACPAGPYLAVPFGAAGLGVPDDGRYDWQDRSTAMRRNFRGFLERVVVGRSQSHPELFAAASPLARIHEGAPPFLLIHGGQDSIIPAGEAREFHHALCAVSGNPVEYVEIPRAGHAFDLVDPSHARRLAVETTRFLTAVHGSHVAGRVASAV